MHISQETFSTFLISKRRTQHWMALVCRMAAMLVVYENASTPLPQSVCQTVVIGPTRPSSAGNLSELEGAQTHVPEQMKHELA